MITKLLNLRKRDGLKRHDIQKGFTLIELLVVISIIALLLSILMPSLQIAREQAKSVVCMSGQKQVGLALQAYCMDSKGKTPPYFSGPHPASQSYTDLLGKTYSQYRRYALITTWYLKGANSDPSRDGDGFLAAYLSTSEKQLRNVLGCPSVKEKPSKVTLMRNGVAQQWSVDRYKSFAINYYGPVCELKCNDAKSPSRLVFMCDAQGHTTFVRRPDLITGTLENNTCYTPAFRHNGKFNAIMLDGHVENGKPDDLYRIEYWKTR